MLKTKNMSVLMWVNNGGQWYFNIVLKPDFILFLEKMNIILININLIKK